MKPSTPKGTRDFLPEVVMRRNYIFSTIRAVFEKYGYLPIETPAMENIETLMGKYGDEGDRLVFKVLARGEKLDKALHSQNNKQLAEEALRYDLTVPFARFVVQHQNEITFPFRRYQIQPVWRADRPQKGRYREFYQCDADVVGTDSLRCEVEYVQIFDEVFTLFGLPVDVRINNRKLLSALAAYIGEPERLAAMTVAIDKLDKLPIDKVLDDLRAQGFGESPLAKLEAVLKLTQNAKDHRALLSEVEKLLGHLPEGVEGARELRYIFEKTEKLGLNTAILTFDLSLARGLNYYTGAIFEVRPRTEAQVGSICGGGRYDNLTGVFGKPGLSGVGISFGADRIYDLLEATNKFPATQAEGTRILFINFGESEADYCHAMLGIIRGAGIRAELYPDASKIQKQMKYANDKHIPYVALAGETEMANNTITLKHMETGEQERIGVDEIIQKLS